MLVKTTIVDQTGIITLNRAEKRNALNPELISNLKEVLDKFKDNIQVKTIIITGEGKAFCAGADIEYLSQLSNYSLTENRTDSENLADLFLQIYEYPKIVIAAVNGPAIAGGCGLASVCDYVVADKNNAKFGYSETRIGFIPAIVSIFLMKRIGEGKARHLLLSAEIIESDKAFNIGLADYLSDNPLDYSLELAAGLNQNSLVSLNLTKKMIGDISSMGVREAVKYCTELNVLSRTSDDFKKGISSFLKK